MIASVSMEYFWCYLWRQSKMKKKKKREYLCKFIRIGHLWVSDWNPSLIPPQPALGFSTNETQLTVWLSAPLMKLFCLYSFPPPDLNSRIKSRLSVRPLSKYNWPVHSVTCTCQKCGMSQKQWAQRRVKESQRDVRRTDWDEGKRYANTRMTSSLREEKKRAESEERREQSHVWNKSERKWKTTIL